MYFVYIDESGEKNPNASKTDPFVLLALYAHEYQIKKFNKIIYDKKTSLLNKIYEREKIKLNITDTEVKSSHIRVTNTRTKNSFLTFITNEELKELTDLYYSCLKITILE